MSGQEGGLPSTHGGEWAFYGIPRSCHDVLVPRTLVGYIRSLLWNQLLLGHSMVSWIILPCVQTGRFLWGPVGERLDGL